MEIKITSLIESKFLSQKETDLIIKKEEGWRFPVVSLTINEKPYFFNLKELSSAIETMKTSE